jgi:hypothetical protein
MCGDEVLCFLLAHGSTVIVAGSSQYVGRILAHRPSISSLTT